jgi:hypothetical protein
MKHQAIDNLYSVFSKYSLNDKVTGHYCPLCLSEEDNVYFHIMPLNSISSWRLNTYFTSANILDGDLNDFKYFIPRIFEIVYLHEDNESWFHEKVWTKLSEAKYTQWTVEEVSTINQFLEYYLNQKILTNDKEQILGAIDDLKEVGYNGVINLSAIKLQ